jgi:hypothetical protein
LSLKGENSNFLSGAGASEIFGRTENLIVAAMAIETRERVEAKRSYFQNNGTRRRYFRIVIPNQKLAELSGLIRSAEPQNHWIDPK